MGPTSDSSVFSARRNLLSQHLRAAGCNFWSAFSAGWARPRNFAHSHFPFRAESHFLFLVGQHIEGALLVFDPQGAACLYMNEPEPEMMLWTGPQPGLEEWAERLNLPVLPYDELPSADFAVLPPQDEATAAWLSALLDRDVEAQSGPELQAADAALADAMVQARLVRDAAAIEQMKWAAQVTAQAHRAGMRRTLQVGYEAGVRAAVEQVFAEHALQPAYNSIVTQQGQILHAEHSLAPLHLGELLLCDAGAESREGWAADVTRTWPVSGKFSPTQREVYEAVLSVQQRAIASAATGVSYQDIHLASQLHMTDALFELGILHGSLEQCREQRAARVFYPHGVGHLLGLDVHDMEDLGDRAGYERGMSRDLSPELRYLRLNRPLLAGMVVTIEPGFYQIPALLSEARTTPELSACIDWERLRKFSDVRGIRIEDDVLITESAPLVLSDAAPKSVEAIEECMGA